MISKTAFFAGLLGCAMLTGCDGSENSPQPSQSTFAELAASKETFKSLEQQIAALQAQNAELVAANERNVATLKITIDDLGKRLADLPASDEITNLRKEASRLQDETTSLKGQIAAKKIEIEDLNKSIAAIPAGQTAEGLVKALTDAQASLNTLTIKAESLESETRRLAKLVPPVADGSKPPAPPAENLASWKIVNRDFHETFTHQPFVSNGYMGLRLPAAGQGYWRGSNSPDNLNGYPDYGPGRFTSAMVEKFYSDNQIYLATLPNWSSLTILDDFNGAFFDPNALRPEQVSAYEQIVDMRKGTVTTLLVWLSPNGKKAKLKWTAFAHRTDKHLGVIRLEITPLTWSGGISVRSYLDLNGIQKADNINQNWSDAAGLGAQASVRTQGTRFKATTAFKMDAPEGAGSAHKWDGNSSVSGLFWEFSPEVNKTYVFTKYVGIATSIDDELIEKLGKNIPQTFADDNMAVNEAADDVANAAKKTGYTELLKTHIDAWEALWTKSSVTVENERLQKVINSAQYQLLSSTYEGAKASIPAGGLVGTGYGGMIFWDAETFMYPYLLLTHPELAKTVVDYRFATLEQARGNVTHSSFSVDPGSKPYRGTYFPWVSGTGNIDGEGSSSDRNRRQIHLQADIALAQYQYYAATGDATFLKNQAWPILKGIADFYVKRGEFNADRTQFHLNTVTAPDEYAENVNDEAFTNGSAIKALELAIKVAEQLKEQVPVEWRPVLGAMVRPQIDPAKNLHIQYNGFNPANLNNRIKQADVVLLTYPLEYPMTVEQSANDLEYYSKAADPDGPSMTDAIHAVIAAQLGRCDFGDFLKKSYDVALGPYEQFNETRVLGASAGQAAPANVFLTGAGGFLQATGMGMTGYRFRDDRIVLKPILPDIIEGQPAKRAYFKGLKWQAREFNVDIGETDTWVTLTKGDAAKVQTTDDDNVLVDLKLGEPLKIATRKARQSDGKPCARPAPETMHLQ